MKAMYSEKYYRNQWERFLKKVPGKHYVNLEADMEDHIKSFKQFCSDEQLGQLRKIFAKKIADNCLELVKEEMAVIQSVEAGKSSFGYTTERQETEARHNYRERFEFNCLQLADFRKKYEV